jgi:hypothetical protein
VVLSGAVTRAQLDANLTALTVSRLPALDLAESPRAYWAARAARPMALSRRPAGARQPAGLSLAIGRR